jgi:Ca-activated chloride channel family protein
MALFEYREWDGSQVFQPQSAEKLFEQLSEYLLHHGEQVLRNLDDDDDDQAEIIELLQKEGFLEKDAEGRWRVAPKGVRRVQERALTELFQTFERGGMGKHDTAHKGGGTARLEETEPYVYGDSLANLNLHETLKNAYVRQGGGVPIHPSMDDFVVHETEYQSSCATVVLIDMSGSMARYGKYYTTKKVALALQQMVRGQYPQDTLRMAGFYTLANPLTERDLIGSAPKPVGIYDSRVHLRLSLDDPLPRRLQHFTNIHAGLKLARSLLARTGSANKQIIVITDGEPTAHLEGREVLLIYPPSEKTARATLAEARRCAQAGIRISSFALIEDYYYLGLVNFVEEMARVTQGVAAYCSAEDLGKFVFDSFIGGRRQRRIGH